MSGTMVKMGKVTEQQERCLQTHKEFLMEEMEGKLIVEKLCSKFIFSSDDKERIVGTEGGRTRRELNGLLVDTLMMRSPEGFEAFFQALSDTGHKKAYDRLRNHMGRAPNTSDNLLNDKSEGDADPREEGGDITEKPVLKRVEELESAVTTLKQKMDVLRMRLTLMDSGGRKEDRLELEEVERLGQELDEAMGELDKLRKEKDDLSARVNEGSEQLKKAEAKIAELESKISEMEAEKETIQNKFKQQAKRLENLHTRVQQSNNKIKDLEDALEEQKADHAREMESQKRQFKRDIGSLHVKMNQEQEERRAVEHKLKEHQFAMTKMKEGMETLSKMFHDHVNCRQNVGQQTQARTLAKSVGRNGNFLSIRQRRAQVQNQPPQYLASSTKNEGEQKSTPAPAKSVLPNISKQKHAGK